MNYEGRVNYMKKTNHLYKDICKFTNTEVPYALGHKINMNHLTCSAGTDTRRRLYIERVHGGYLGHCFNCGLSGWKFDKEQKEKVLSEFLYEVDETSTSHSGVPKTFMTLLNGYNKAIDDSTISEAPLGEYSHTNALAKSYYYLHGITEEDLAKMGVLFFNNQSYLPVREYDSPEIVGFVVRDFCEGAVYKYKNVFKDNKYPYFAGKQVANKEGMCPLVITEDALSAYRINKATGIHSMALLGTKITDNYLEILRRFRLVIPGSLPPITTHFVVWLDADIAGMQATSEVLQKLQSMNGYKQMVPHGTKEAKKLSDQEIIEVIDRTSGFDLKKHPFL